MKWKEIKWADIESRVFKLQERIFKASTSGNKGTVRFLQNVMIHSLDAKLLSVRRVTTDASGKHTAGVDSVILTTPEQKIRLVSNLCVDGVAAPIRRVWIPKPGQTEKRPLGIPTIRDRAKQKLVLLALEPEWEAKFEPNSYGFRPGRSCWDAIEAVFLSIRSTGGKNDAPKYILEADLKGCFNNIDHDYLLKTLDSTPQIMTQVAAWLKSGIFDGLTLKPEDYSSIRPNDLGTPQGGVISPFLANVALHGLEEHLNKWICTQTLQYPPGCRHWNFTENKVKGLATIRYADDFVVIHREREIVELAKVELQKLFNSTHRLEFSAEKTRVTISTEGFSFLGFRIINIFRNGKMRVKIYPSNKAQERIIQKVNDTCLKMRAATTYALIEALRPKILGWANYYRYCECSDVFSNTDYSIYQILRKWVFRRNKRQGKTKVKEDYFPAGKIYTYQGQTHKNNWVLNGETKHKVTNAKVTNHLVKLSWITSEKYVKVKGEKSIYDGDQSYWLLRRKNQPGVSIRVKTLFRRQKGKCTLCRALFTERNYQVDHVLPISKGGKDEYKNLQLVHTHCHILKTRTDAKS